MKTAHEAIATFRAEINRRIADYEKQIEELESRDAILSISELGDKQEELRSILCFLEILEVDFDNADPKHLVHQHIGKEKLGKLNLSPSGSGAWGITPPAYKLDVKPARWSEEDREMIDYAYGLCYAAHETAHSAQDANKATKCMSWLKSPPPPAPLGAQRRADKRSNRQVYLW